MAKRIILSGEEMQDKILAGCKKLNDIVASTLGPSGKNVIINEGNNKHRITNDGYQIVNAFQLEDTLEDFGANLIKESSIRTNTNAGDGTSSSILLSYAMLKEGIKELRNGINPNKIKIGMKLAEEFIINKIDSYNKPVETFEDIWKIANISSNNDPEIADLITNTYRQIGLDGIINYERIEGNEIITIIRKGYHIEKGYYDPYFITDKSKGTCTYEDCLVWFGNTGNYKDLLPILDLIQKEKKPLLIISQDDTDPELLNIFKNPMNKDLKVCLITGPSFDTFRKDLLEDIQIYTNAQEGLNGFIGSCQSFTVSNKDTIIVNGAGKQETINERIQFIQSCLDNTKPSFHNMNLNARIASLNAKLGILKIGARSNIERGELLDRIDDVVKACKSSIEEGILIGGGYTLHKISKEMQEFISADPEIQIGINIVRKSLNVQLITILKNSSHFLDLNKLDQVFNAKTGELEDPEKTNIFDSTRGIKCGIQNSISIINTILLSDNLIY